MTNILCGINSFCHRAHCQCFYQVLFFLALYIIQQLIDGGRNLGVFTGCFQVVAELADKCREVLQFVGIGHIMYAVDEGFGLQALPWFTNVGSHRFIGQQHEFFHQLVRVFLFLEIYTQRFAFPVNFKTHFHPVKGNGAGFETLLTQLLCQFVKCKNFLLKFTFACFYNALCFFVSETADAAGYGAGYLIVEHFSLIVHLKKN